MKTGGQKPPVPGWVGIVGVFGLIGLYVVYREGRERGSNRVKEVLDETGWEYEEWAASKHAVTDVRQYWLKVIGFTLLANVLFVLVLGLVGAVLDSSALGIEFPLLVLVALLIYSLAHIGSMCYRHGYYIGQNKSW